MGQLAELNKKDAEIVEMREDIKLLNDKNKEQEEIIKKKRKEIENLINDKIAQNTLIDGQHKVIMRMLDKLDEKIIETEQEYDKAIQQGLDTREPYLKKKFLLQLKSELKQL